jgi:hypothetical protein
MKARLEITESMWIATYREQVEVGVDQVRIDALAPRERPWLETDRERVEWVGVATPDARERALERALDLDLDFLAIPVSAVDEAFLRSPIRLVLDDTVPADPTHWAHPGVAWARRVVGWERLTPEALAALARAERLILAGHDRLPDPQVLETAGVFALEVPESVSPAELRAWCDLEG